MSAARLPRYPIYVPSKGRARNCLTARFLKNDKIPFCLVVEEQEAAEYAELYGDDSLLVLPFRDQGSVIPARNWIKRHATEAGHDRHWQLDDNIVGIRRLYKGYRVYCDSKIGLRVMEDFTDRYENIAIAGPNYYSFGVSPKSPPFCLNTKVYSCSLVLNSIENEWRGIYNEDTDICLQVLGDGWCTVQFNAFLAHKTRTITMDGGNAGMYKGDGRLEMANSLKRVWPHIVHTDRRFNRPQHMVRDCWRSFDTQLIRKEGVDFSGQATNEYGMTLKAIAPKVKSPELRDLVAGYGA